MSAGGHIMKVSELDVVVLHPTVVGTGRSVDDGKCALVVVEEQEQLLDVDAKDGKVLVHVECLARSF